jgi:hypothetical protein
MAAPRPPAPAVTEGPTQVIEPGPREPTARNAVLKNNSVHAELRLAAAPESGAGPLEIPYAIRWLVPKGERFANFDILNRRHRLLLSGDRPAGRATPPARARVRV